MGIELFVKVFKWIIVDKIHGQQSSRLMKKEMHNKEKGGCVFLMFNFNHQLIFKCLFCEIF
jgi:hypothetical protein